MNESRLCQLIKFNQQVELLSSEEFATISSLILNIFNRDNHITTPIPQTNVTSKSIITFLMSPQVGIYKKISNQSIHNLSQLIAKHCKIDMNSIQYTDKLSGEINSDIWIIMSDFLSTIDTLALGQCNRHLYVETQNKHFWHQRKYKNEHLKLSDNSMKIIINDNLDLFRFSQCSQLTIEHDSCWKQSSYAAKRVDGKYSKKRKCLLRTLIKQSENEEQHTNWFRLLVSNISILIFGNGIEDCIESVYSDNNNGNDSYDDDIDDVNLFQLFFGNHNDKKLDQVTIGVHATICMLYDEWWLKQCEKQKNKEKGKQKKKENDDNDDGDDVIRRGNPVARRLGYIGRDFENGRALNLKQVLRLHKNFDSIVLDVDYRRYGKLAKMDKKKVKQLFHPNLKYLRMEIDSSNYNSSNQDNVWNFKRIFDIDNDDENININGTCTFETFALQFNGFYKWQMRSIYSLFEDRNIKYLQATNMCNNVQCLQFIWNNNKSNFYQSFQSLNRNIASYDENSSIIYLANSLRVINKHFVKLKEVVFVLKRGMARHKSTIIFDELVNIICRTLTLLAKETWQCIKHIQILYQIRPFRFDKDAPIVHETMYVKHGDLQQSNRMNEVKDLLTAEKLKPSHLPSKRIDVHVTFSFE